MSLADVIDFLSPESDWVQWIFLSIILGLMAFTITSTHLAAKPKFWERKWNRNTPDDHSDDLDIDHGSVTDLCYAVETWPEKLASIMPGMLLVIGLLGTFLGLGVALNHASHIMAQPNALSAGGAAGSMQDLLGLLKGLGTKFKTSTWGISGFLVLTIWARTLGFDEARLGWVIGKVKFELMRRKESERSDADAKQQALFDVIADVSKRITDGFSNEIAKTIGMDQSLHKNSLYHLNANFEKISNTISAGYTDIVTGINHHLSTLVAADQVRQDKFLHLIRTDLANGNAVMKITSDRMEEFTSKTHSIISSMAIAAQGMENGAKQVGIAADGLVNAVSAFEAQVGDFKTQFTTVLQEVNVGLGNAIQDLSRSASETLREGSEKLGSATKEISTALGILSSDVKETMFEVKGSISDSLAIQQRSSNLFIESTQALNENVVATTGLVEKLGEDITSGLSAVSTAGQTMTGIGKALKISVENAKELPDILKSLEMTLTPLGSIPEYYQALMLEFQGLRAENNINGAEERQQIVEALGTVVHGIKELPKVLAPLGVVSRQNQALLGEVQTMRSEIRDQGAAERERIVDALSALVTDVKNLPRALSPLFPSPTQQVAVLDEVRGLRAEIASRSGSLRLAESASLPPQAAI